MKIAILSDTHGLLRPEVLEHLKDADAILHGGDINKQSIVDQLRQYAQFFFLPVVLYLYIKIAVVEHRLQFFGVSFGSVIVACQKTLGNGACDTCGQANQVFRMLAQ